LDHPVTHKATYFSYDLGPIPAWTTSLYCRACSTRFHPNYYVHDTATIRTYYSSDVPDVLHVAQYTFLDRRLCELFTNQMVFAWTSATNCARVYNATMAQEIELLNSFLLDDRSFTIELDTERVLASFLLYSLSNDFEDRNDILELPQNITGTLERLQCAIRERNVRMAGPGQEHWTHLCDICSWHTTNEDGQDCIVRSVVTDGLTIGHPCCAVHNCQQPLPSAKGTRYCTTHQEREKKCAVDGCDAQAEPRHKTCSDRTHRSIEEYRYLAIQQLNWLGSVSTSTNQSENITEVDKSTATQNIACIEKPNAGNRTLSAQFGRRRTHNEQLCVASCGVIRGRATFFGAEAVSSVLEFWDILFPTDESLPEVMWYDSNCRVSATLNASAKDKQQRYARIALPVDVFHFKSKHKVTDEWCGSHCNPYMWKELRTDDGRNWRFNSSAAEQANVWFGGYQAVVREMQVDRYNFFLDEMIKRRNRVIVAELKKKRANPYNVPRHVLLGSST
ncbi:hypothetical protein PUNSTDRAFT_62687, partial [Punctularia strigosozonata HHB-11173 SS5]|uniref:uncharacterized protein n=1 Tax=Punctularia strigosozonata (strain HHB-11173) TaxID=741275 RepID=UPI0004417B52